MPRVLRVGSLLLAVLAIGVGGFLWWWNSGPSPTREVRAYFASTGRADVVDVSGCRHSEDPRPPSQYPEYDVFLCEIRSGRAIRLRFNKMLPESHSFFCFHVPRAAPRATLFRNDHDASPYFPAASRNSCFSER